MKNKERTIKWLKVVTVCLLLGYAFIAGMAVDEIAIAKAPEPESAFYVRWYESVFPPEVQPEPVPFYTRWYESVFPPEVVVEPEPEPAFYTRWYESVFSKNDEEVDEVDETVEIKKPQGLKIVVPEKTTKVEPALS